MFGIGFTELLLIAVVAILFLGPDKLPGAMVEVAKLIKSIRQTITDAKGSLEEEIKVSDLKEEALTYKKQLDDATEELKGFKNLAFDEIEELNEETQKPLTPAEKHRAQVEAKHQEMMQGSEKAVEVETKQEYTEIKSKPQKAANTYAEAPKVAQTVTDETTKGEA